MSFVFFIFICVVIGRLVMSQMSKDSKTRVRSQFDSLRGSTRVGGAPVMPGSKSGPPRLPPPPPVAGPPPATWPSGASIGPPISPGPGAQNPITPMVMPVPEAPAADTTSLDSSLSSSSLTGPAELSSHDAIVGGLRLVPLTPDQERRVMEFMDMNYEVGAVRLVCDETHAGILEAQKTVRTLAGLPTL